MKNVLPFALATGAALIGAVSSPLSAQSFPGFTPGNLVVSRSVYSGSASTLVVGQPLPPVCQSVCGTVTATDSGAFPVNGSSNNVWNNDAVDGSFGITAPIFLDQITPAGALVNTLAIPTDMLTTSFSSKSELAVNLSSDGTALTFMGYIAPVNAIDVSNSNTPEVDDPTNPAAGNYYRSVAQVSGSGAIQITATNSFSGNNGRAAALANGLYYMVGNANNGSGTASNIIASAGAQIATPGQSPNTPPTEIGNFSITQVNDPSTGMPYVADKLGKDNNFRGLTIFNNTMYVTKGSGGNGINTVYQVGTAGTLPTVASASAAPITILPGFPTTLAKATGAGNPFGIWFANATTLYVADEGDGSAADAPTSTNAGLQKWTLANGTWTRNYVLQSGLGLGVPYAIANYPTAINPATDGLRNIIGRVNSDGTVTVWAVTSTVSANGDQGADPNRLVAITDVLANTSATTALNEHFATIRAAGYGEVLRGVSFTPATVASTTATGSTSISSSANPGAVGAAPGSLATVYGLDLANATAPAPSGSLPATLGGTSVSIVDAAGATAAAPLLYVSPTQVNFQVPSSVAVGAAQVIVTSGDGTKSPGTVLIQPVVPSLFTFNGSGLVAAYAILVAADGTQTVEQVFSTGTGGALTGAPVSLGASTQQAYLIAYGTGLGSAALTDVTATIGGVAAPVVFAGPLSSSPGLDQINIQIPSSLAGSGSVTVQITVAGIAANPVQFTIQ